MKELKLVPEQIIPLASDLFGYGRLRKYFSDYRDRGIGAVSPVFIVDGKREEAVRSIKKEFETALVSPFPPIIQRDRMVYLSPSAKNKFKQVAGYAELLLEKIGGIEEPFYLIDGLETAMAGSLYCSKIPALKLESDEDVLFLRRSGKGIRTPRLLIRRKTLEETTRAFEEELLNNANGSFYSIRTVAVLVEYFVENKSIPEYIARYYLHKKEDRKR